MVRLVLSALIVCFAVLPLSAETSDDAFGKLPLIFEPNLGQANRSVRFIARGNGYGLALSDTEAILSLLGSEPAAVHMKLRGARKAARIYGVDPQPGASRYFFGSTEKWIEPVPHFSKVRYESVYPGVDLIYYGNQRRLEFDFVVAPRANARSIELDFSGVQGASIDPHGDLILDTAAGPIRYLRPVAYQERNGVREFVSADFVLRGKRRAGFKLGAYDRDLPLVIDPILVYSSYFGGSAAAGSGDLGYDVVVDGAGNTYVTGVTASTDFLSVDPVQPSPGGGLDAFIMKIDSTGKTILTASYLGGSGADESLNIALDQSGNIYIAGYTASTNFPIVNGHQRQNGGGKDAFLVKLNSAGSEILYATYLGGARDDTAFGLALGPDGTVFISGETASANFPLVAPLQSQMAGGFADAFLAKLSPGGALVYSTFLGGRGNDRAYDVASDADGAAYLTGFTSSVDFPTANAIIPFINRGNPFPGLQATDAFVAKVNPVGNGLVFSTYWGGVGSENGVRLTVDSDRNVYVTGNTQSLDFPIKNALQPLHAGPFDANGAPAPGDGYDGFLIKFNPDGSDVAFSTFLGGEGVDSGAGIALDSAGAIYVTGYTGSFIYHVVNSAQGFKRGGLDGFVTKLTSDGSQIIYSTYHGGDGDDAVIGLAVDASANAYVVGRTRSTSSFTVVNAFQETNAGGQDGFISKINADDVRTSAPFNIGGQNVSLLTTTAGTSSTTFGYVTAEVTSGAGRPSGLAVIDLRQSGQLITEAAFPLSPFLSNGRFFVEQTTSVNTAVSFVNPSSEEIEVAFDFTNLSGEVSNSGSFKLPAGGYLSGIVSQDPFRFPTEVLGTLSFSSSAPVAVAAFRSFTGGGTRLLVTPLPISNSGGGSQNTPVTVPQFADSLGWTTQIVLVNPTEDPMSGEIRFFRTTGLDRPGEPIEVGLQEGAGSVFQYEIPGRSAKRFSTTGLGESLMTGYVDVVAASGSNTPDAFALATFTFNGVTTTDSTIEALRPGSDFRIYAEASGNFNQLESLSTRPGVAIANPSDQDATVRLELTDLNGNAVGSPATFTLPRRGHIARFLHELDGFQNMPVPFKGLLRVRALPPGPGIVVVGVRGRFNEFQNFLLTATGPIKSNAGSGSIVVFPHLVNGGGFATQLILVSESGGAAAGQLRFSNQAGQPLYMGVQ